MKPKDIFGLAVRLLGLWFLYLGLRAATPLLDLGADRWSSREELVSLILPVVFNLAVAAWLLSGKLLVRWAYPEERRNLSAVKPAASTTEAAHSSETDAERTEKRLASLVEKPKSVYATQS
ncbi:MAG TPA: hypothetical protein VMB22_01875 [Verrucomicrobiae bacterium]|nr:hypothetical protein [Verrucomicrobiae bacterium]